MANPQKENGYVPIANDILDALAKIRIPGEARQILDVIIRKTWGYNKKNDKISLSQFSYFTGMKKTHVIRALYKLIGLNIIIKNSDGDINIYSVQKDHEKWQPLSKKITTFKPLSKMVKYCYICGFDEAIHSHHIIPRSECGSNSYKNKINLCPNCHALVHKGKYSREFLVTKKDNVEKPLSKKITQRDISPKKPLSKKVHTIDNTTINNKPKDILPEKKTPAESKELLSFFGKQYKQKTSNTYLASFAKEITIFKSVLKIHKIEVIKQLIIKFFTSEDDFIIKSGMTVGVFYSQINKLNRPKTKEEINDEIRQRLYGD